MWLKCGNDTIVYFSKAIKTIISTPTKKFKNLLEINADKAALFYGVTLRKVVFAL